MAAVIVRLCNVLDFRLHQHEVAINPDDICKHSLGQTYI